MSRTITKIALAISRFEDAVRAHEMRGAQRPKDVEGIIQEYTDALAHLTDLIAESINERVA